MSPKTTPETPIRIDSAEALRKEVGFTEAVTLEWKEGQVIEATRADLNGLKTSMAGKTATEKQKATEEFVRAREKQEAEQDLTTQIGNEVSKGLKDTLVKSGVVVGAIGAGTALAHGLSSKVAESTGININFLSKFQSWAREELKTADNGLWKWILGMIAGESVTGGVDLGKSDKKEGGDVVKQEAEKFLSAKSYDVTTKLLIYGVAREKFDTALGAAISGVRDATWGLDDVKKRDEVTSQAIIVLGMNDVKKLSWAQISSLGESGLIKLTGEDSSKNRAAIKLIFTMLGRYQAERIGKVFAPNDWKSIPLEKVMTTLYTREGHGKIEELTDKLKNIDLSNVTDIQKNIFLNITIVDGALKSEGILKSDFDSLKSQGISLGFIGKIIDIESGKQKVGDYEKYIAKENLSPQEKVFIQKVLDSKTFLDPLKSSLKERFGFTDGMLGLISHETLSIKDLMELYLLTQGTPDIGKMNKGRRALLFTKIQILALGSNPSVFGEYMNKLIKEGAEKYPDAIEVGVMVDSLVNYGAYKSAFAMISGGEQFFAGLLATLGIKIDSRMGLAFGALGGLGGLIWLAIKLSPIGRIASIVAMLAGALGIAGFTVAQTSGKQ